MVQHDGLIAPDARVTTEGLASYDGDSLGKRLYERIVQSKAERPEGDALQVCHWTISLRNLSTPEFLSSAWH